MTYVKDEVIRDSLYANRYNDKQIQAIKPISYKKQRNNSLNK